MTEDDFENTEKKEYSVGKNYNQSLSSPNLNLNSTLGINMQNFDSANLSSLRRREKILGDNPSEEKEKEEMPKITEIYGDNNVYKEDTEVSENKIGDVKTNKVAPEYTVAAITTALIIIFMILSFFLYNMFVG